VGRKPLKKTAPTESWKHLARETGKRSLSLVLACSILLLYQAVVSGTALAQPGFIIRTIITAYPPGDLGMDPVVRSYADYNSPLDVNLFFNHAGSEPVLEILESRGSHDNPTSPGIPGIEKLTSNPLGLFLTDGLGSHLLDGQDVESRSSIGFKPAFMLGEKRYDPKAKGVHSHLQLEDEEEAPRADFNFGKFFATFSHKF
jgi:hypothetical protein